MTAAETENQYVITNRLLKYEDARGRWTHIEEDINGIILTEENIDSICKNASAMQRQKCQNMLDKVKESPKGFSSVLLISGFPCIVPSEFFTTCDEPRYPVSMEVS